MRCECLVDGPNQGLVRCANKATQRLTISHLKIRLLACEACGARQLAWAEPYRSLPGLVVVEPAAALASASKSLAQVSKIPGPGSSDIERFGPKSAERKGRILPPIRSANLPRPLMVGAFSVGRCCKANVN